MTAINGLTGDINWMYTGDATYDSASTSGAIGADGTLYYATSYYRLNALSSLGSPLWLFDLQASVPVATKVAGACSAPVLDPQSVVYTQCGAAYPYLYALYPSGSLKWQYYTSADAPSAKISDLAQSPFDLTLYYMSVFATLSRH